MIIKKRTKLRRSRIKVNSLYVHIPFCRNICPYCDFTKVIHTEDFENRFVEQLLKDIKKVSSQSSSFYTIYIGGGTPSCLSNKSLTLILRALSKLRNRVSCEFTIEANPEDINEEFLKTLVKFGVNRISIGIQSIKKETLDSLNRKYLDFKSKIKEVKNYISNINVDFIFGLPNENREDVENNLDFFLKLDVPHISIYSLTVSPGTIFYNKKIKEIEEEENRELYDLIVKTLKDHDYIHYEISNFAKIGYESRHNINYREGKRYIGIGPGACGFIDNIRYMISKNLTTYFNGLRDYKEDFLDIEKQKVEYIMLNLRTIWGINLKDYYKKFDVNLYLHKFDTIKELEKEGLLKANRTSIKATEKGMAILDTLILKLID